MERNLWQAQRKYHPRSYTYRDLIEVYIESSKQNHVHRDFEDYYAGLLGALEQRFGIRIDAGVGAIPERRALRMLFQSTIKSLHKVSTPWDGYLEDGLLHKKLEECGELGFDIYRASDAIGEAAKSSCDAHREMLGTLFVAIFGPSDHLVTSEELRQEGFDDSTEPQIEKYWDCY